MSDQRPYPQLAHPVWILDHETLQLALPHRIDQGLARVKTDELHASTHRQPRVGPRTSPPRGTVIPASHESRQEKKHEPSARGYPGHDERSPGWGKNSWSAESS